MAIFNGGRMVAPFLFVLFALNVSFAQDGRTTIVVYMEDPIPVDEQLAPEAREYLDKLNDPFTWETEQDFQDARNAQIAQVERDNATREQKAEDFLKDRYGAERRWYKLLVSVLDPFGSCCSFGGFAFQECSEPSGREALHNGPKTERERVF